VLGRDPLPTALDDGLAAGDWQRYEELFRQVLRSSTGRARFGSKDFVRPRSSTDLDRNRFPSAVSRHGDEVIAD
jgi:hypothetical protein